MPLLSDKPSLQLRLSNRRSAVNLFSLLAVVGWGMGLIFAVGAATDASLGPALIPTAEIHLARGDHHCTLREYDHAIREYTLALQLNPDFAEAYNNRAYATVSKKDGTGHPLDDLNRALSLRPNFPHALNTRGCVYLASGEINRALADFNRALQLQPNYPRAYQNRGNAHLRQGEIRLAIADFEAAGRRPKRVLAWLGGILVLVLALIVAAGWSIRVRSAECGVRAEEGSAE
jgi:tetratricopeptide (TPR) repeat protein